MDIKLSVAASDMEPGTILFNVEIDKQAMTIPLRGNDALAFAQQLARAYMTAFSDMVATNAPELKSIIAPLQRLTEGN